MSGCHYCGTASDLRPYGPGHSMVCFPCATATPERERAAFQNFAVQLDAAGPIACIGTDVGPYPIRPSAEAS